MYLILWLSSRRWHRGSWWCWGWNTLVRDAEGSNHLRIRCGDGVLCHFSSIWHHSLRSSLAWANVSKTLVDTLKTTKPWKEEVPHRSIYTTGTQSTCPVPKYKYKSGWRSFTCPYEWTATNKNLSDHPLAIGSRETWASINLRISSKDLAWATRTSCSVFRGLCRNISIYFHQEIMEKSGIVREYIAYWLGVKASELHPIVYNISVI